MNSIFKIKQNRKRMFKFLLVLCLISLALSTSGCKKEEIIISSKDELTDPAVQPKVIFSSPSHQSVGPYPLYAPGDQYSRPNIILRFNKLMRKESVQPGTIRVSGFDRPVVVRLMSNYYYYRDVKNSVADHATSDDFYNDLFSLSISDSSDYYYGGARSTYRIGQLYTLTIDSTLEDINGNRFSGAFNLTFEPEPAFRVTSMIPLNGSKDVDRFTTMTLAFNNKVNAAIFSSLQVTPSTPGVWRIAQYDSHYVSYYPTSPLGYNTLYTMTAASGAQDVDGNVSTRSFASTVRTIAFQTTSQWPRDRATNIPTSTNISIEFSGGIDTATARAAFSISPPVAGIFYSAYDRQLQFFPQQELASGTTYTVSLSTTLKSVEGVSLAAPLTFRFTTDRFRVLYTNPSNGNLYVYRGSSIGVYLNAPIDTATVRSSFKTSPNVTGTFSLYANSSGFSFLPASPLAANTTYTVTVSTSLISTRGEYFGEPYSFFFVTGSSENRP